MHDQPILLAISDGEDKSSPLKNCMRNNYKHLRKWAKRTKSDCFRLYDRGIKEYPVVIDYYAGRFCAQYFTDTRQDDEPPLQLVEEVESALCSLFEVVPEIIFWRIRKKREKTEQYEKRDGQKDFFIVLEYGVKFKINLQDYLDTGLFLDHRETRQLVALQAKQKRLLNLFAYTCSFSVHAAAKGAAFTKSVDMSNTYTEWGKQNFILNGLALNNHPVIRADCMKFLDDEISTGIKYDVIVIDPPTLSRSKKMEQMFDIQRDYIFLLSRALRLLSTGGVVYFSTNSRKFVLDESLFSSCSIVDITGKTIPHDFHRAKVHRCWKITCKG